MSGGGRSHSGARYADDSPRSGGSLSAQRHRAKLSTAVERWWPATRASGPIGEHVLNCVFMDLGLGVASCP